MSGKSKKNASVKNVEAPIVENEVAVIETAPEVNETADLDNLDSLITLSKTENRGRKVDLTSARQIRLAVKAALAESGMSPGRGRKVDATSVRQQRLNAFAAKWAGSEAVKRGRPKKPVTIVEVPAPEVPAEETAAE